MSTKCKQPRHAQGEISGLHDVELIDNRLTGLPFDTASRMGKGLDVNFTEHDGVGLG